MSESRKRSSIWLHFTDTGDEKPECRICKAKISIKAGSTTNLHRHLRNTHSILQEREPSRRQSCKSIKPGKVLCLKPSSSTVSNVLPETAAIAHSSTGQTKTSTKKMTSHKWKNVDEELAKMIARDFQPVSIVEDKGFKAFVHALNPMYVPPSRQTLSQTIIPRLYNTEHALWQDKVKKASAVCLTTDCWTSRTRCSNMSLTCHFIEDFKMTSCLLDCFEFTESHTASDLAEELLRVAKEWHVDDKVVCCVTHNAANVIEAVKMLEWNHQTCLVQTINQIIKDALNAVKPTVDKVKTIVEFFRKCTVATETLKSIQRQMGMPEQKPKEECATRCNSTFFMLKRMIESKDAIISTLADLGELVEPLSEEEWETVKEVCDVLEPYEEVTVEMTRERYLETLYSYINLQSYTIKDCSKF